MVCIVINAIAAQLDWRLPETTLHPTSIHFELALAIHQHAPIHGQIQDLKASIRLGNSSIIPDRACAVILLPYRALQSSLSLPDTAKLSFVEKVDPGPITSHVKVLIQISTLFEPNLSEIATSVISE